MTWRSRGTLYCEDDICQDRRVKEQPERSTVQPLYLVRLAVLQTVYLQIKLSTKAKANEKVTVCALLHHIAYAVEGSVVSSIFQCK